jgi:hypothetical protein
VDWAHKKWPRHLSARNHKTHWKAGIVGEEDDQQATAEESVRVDREWLRAVADEVRSKFPKPFADVEVVLVDIDPYRLFAFWNIPFVDYERVALASGLTHETARPVLRLARFSEDDVTAAAAFKDIMVAGLQSRVYLEADPPGGVFRASLGIKGADGVFTPLATSNAAALPFPAPKSAAAFRPEGATAQPWRSTADGQETIDALAVYAAVPDSVRESALVDEATQAKLAAADARVNDEIAQGNRPPFAARNVDGAPNGAPEEYPLPPAFDEPFTPPSIADANGHDHSDEAMEIGVLEGADGGTANGTGSGENRLTIDKASESDEPLALETILPISSFVFSEGENGSDVALEIVAEVHLHGRAKPGIRLELFGTPIALRPDGSFLVRRLLPRDPELLNALFASHDGWQEIDG